MGEKQDQIGDRRNFLASCAALSAGPLILGCVDRTAVAQEAPNVTVKNPGISEPVIQKSIIGDYGSWAGSLVSDPPALSFRQKKWDNVDAWRSVAQTKALELLAQPDLGGVPQVTVDKRYSYDGLDVEELHWQLPNGHSTQAVVLKPKDAKGPLPAILGLHEHGGNKYFGKRKLIKTTDSLHPVIVDSQKKYYDGRAWANEIAKRGYVVLVHDGFAFGNRRVRFNEMATIPWGEAKTKGKSDENPEDPANIEAYNSWANGHESVLAKSLFCAGTTWPGVVLTEDQRALDVLANREDVDAENLGCAGLSGGGLRAVYLGGLDARIKCAICVGFMSTWKDFLMNRSFTHTWMTYTPLLAKYLDFPEILGLRVPLPTMVLSSNEDNLYTRSEMKRADAILKEVFAKASAADHYRGGFYPGDHKFDLQMQQDAFNWFDQWLTKQSK